MRVETIKFSDFMSIDKRIEESNRRIEKLDKEMKTLKELAFFVIIALIGLELFSMMPKIFIGFENVFR